MSSLKIQLLVFNLACTGVIAVLVWRLRQRLSDHPGGDGSAGLPFSIAVLIAFGLAAWNGDAIYMADESTYRYGAALYAEGTWSTPAPAFGTGPDELQRSEFLSMYLVAKDGRLFPIYPAGWPAILAAFSLAIPSYYVNPVLTIGALAGVWWGARRWLPPGAASGALWVLALTGMWTLNCAGYTSHVACSLWTLLAALSAGLAWEKKQDRYVVGAFLCCAGAFLTRPMNGALCFGLIAAALTFRLGYKRVVVALTPALAVALGLSIWQNIQTTGDWRVDGYKAYFGGANANITGDFSTFVQRSLPLAVRRMGDSVAASFPALAALVLAALLPARTRKPALILLGIAGAHVAGYTLNPVDSDSPIGERYFQEGWLFMCAAAGIGWSNLRGAAGRASWVVPVLACALSGWGMASLAWFHHTLRQGHAAVVAQKDAMSRNVDMVFLRGAPPVNPQNYLLNPPNYRSARVLFLPAPKEPRHDTITRALGRRCWREVEVRLNPASFVETRGNCLADP